MTLVQVLAPHFVAGLVAEDRRVVRAAPILRYMVGWDGARVAAYCRRQGWEFLMVDSDEERA